MTKKFEFKQLQDAVAAMLSRQVGYRELARSAVLVQPICTLCGIILADSMITPQELQPIREAHEGTPECKILEVHRK